jgi:hypothetical protein
MPASTAPALPAARQRRTLAEALALGLDRRPQHAQIVLAAEQVAERPDLGAPRLDLRRPDVAQQLQMIAVILRALTPGVEARIARGDIDRTHGLARAPVDTLEARRQIVESARCAGRGC